MRFLFLNQFFWPDTAATGQLLSDVAEYMANSGETVEVICGAANYGGSNHSPQPKVIINRLRTPASSHGYAGRIGSYATFFAGSIWNGLRGPAPDVVVTLTTPPLVSLVGLVIQRLRGARHVVWEMDLYPDIAVDLGVLKAESLPAKLFGRIADLPRRRADRVIALGECARSRLLAHGLDEDKVDVAENWADSDAVPGSESHVAPVRSEGLSIIYSGNFGRAHDVTTIAGAMAEVDGADERFRFRFGGGGSRNAWIQDFCEARGLKNAEFLPYCERQELKPRLAASDIGLVTQHAKSAGAIVPSKSYGIMAAGRPVLFIGPRDSTVARTIERYDCGWQIDCGDVPGLVKLLRELAANKELVYAAGERAYEAFVRNYQRSQGVARLAALLQSVSPAYAPALDAETEAIMATDERG